MSYIAFTTTIMSGVGTVFSCLQLADASHINRLNISFFFFFINNFFLLKNQPIAVKMQFGPVALISIACLFVCAWPADNLIKVVGSS